MVAYCLGRLRGAPLNTVDLLAMLPCSLCPQKVQQNPHVISCNCYYSDCFQASMEVIWGKITSIHEHICQVICLHFIISGSLSSLVVHNRCLLVPYALIWLHVLSRSTLYLKRILSPALEKSKLYNLDIAFSILFCSPTGPWC